MTQAITESLYQVVVVNDRHTLHIALAGKKLPDGTETREWQGILCDYTRPEAGTEEFSGPFADDKAKKVLRCQKCTEFLPLRELRKLERRQAPDSGLLGFLNRANSTLTNHLSKAMSGTLSPGTFQAADLQKYNYKGEPTGELSEKSLVWTKAVDDLAQLSAEVQAGATKLEANVVPMLSKKLFVSPNLVVAVLAHMADEAKQKPSLAAMRALVGQPVPSLPSGVSAPIASEIKAGIAAATDALPPVMAKPAVEPTNTETLPPLRTMTGTSLGHQFFEGKEPPVAGRMEPIKRRSTNKPWGGLWTSTYLGPQKGSAWVQHCLAHELRKPPFHGFQLTPRADARICAVDSRDDLLRLFERYGTDGLAGDRLLDYERLAKDFDAMHVTVAGRQATETDDELCVGYSWGTWEVESTCWFRWCFDVVDDLGLILGANNDAPPLPAPATSASPPSTEVVSVAQSAASPTSPASESDADGGTAQDNGRRKKMEYQDVGNIPGARKHQMLKTFLEAKTAEALAELEKDEVSAIKAVTKTHLIGKFDAAAYRDAGYTAGAAYLIYETYKVVAPRPHLRTKGTLQIATQESDTTAAREQYRKGVVRLRELLEPAKTVGQVVAAIKGLGQLLNGATPNAEDYVDTASYMAAKDAFQKGLGEWRPAFHALGSNFYNRFVGQNKSTWYDQLGKGHQYQANNDWSWAEFEGSGGAGNQLPKWNRPKLTAITRIGGAPTPTAAATDYGQVFTIRAVQFGNWVDDADGSYHVENCGAAFADLAEVLGLPPAAIAGNGKLGIAFGARGHGKAVAHYEPLETAINITKQNGDGSVAHEWGHFMDNMIYRASFGATGGKLNGFLSDGKGGRYVPNELLAAYSDWARLLSVGAAPLPVTVDSAKAPGKWKHYAHFLEKAGGDVSLAVAALKSVYGGTSLDRLREIGQDFANIANTTMGKHVTDFQVPTGKSQFYADAVLLGDYWKRGHELFARSFEAYVEDEMAAAGRKNTYLVNGTAPDLGGPYPKGAERTAFRAAMGRIMKAVVAHGLLTK